MEFVRRRVKALLPFLHLATDIDYALAYEALIREFGFRVRFPKSPNSGVIVGTLRRKGLKATRDMVSFEWVGVE